MKTIVDYINPILFNLFNPPELDGVSRPVNGLVCLEENRITLVNVGQLLSLVKGQWTGALGAQGIRATAKVADSGKERK